MFKVNDAGLKFTGELTPLEMDKVTHIIIHHIAAAKATVEDVHRWNLERETNGVKWLGIGYNLYVRSDGSIWQGRGFNVGAHCIGHNHTSYGIGLEGNFDITSPTPAQIDTLRTIIPALTKNFPNFERIGGHREFYNTDCPGKNCNVDVFKTSTVEQAIYHLVQHGVIKSPEYWLVAVKNDKINPEFLKQLIINMSNALK